MGLITTAMGSPMSALVVSCVRLKEPSAAVHSAHYAVLRAL
jgi:hypothetical protein